MPRRFVRWVPAMILTAGLTVTLAQEAHPQALADYTSYPPFVSEAVVPNIMLIYDNSESMRELAYSKAEFSNALTYGGIFEPMECYRYTGDHFAPSPAANPDLPGPCMALSYPWSGNLLNYVSMRRVDIVKWVMIGGLCEVGGRNVEGMCTTRLKSQPLTGVGQSNEKVKIKKSELTDLIPSDLLHGEGLGDNVHFLSPALSPSLAGTFCVDDDDGFPESLSLSCDDSDKYDEEGFKVEVAVSTPKTGVIQEVGNKARLSLMHFDATLSGDGGPVVAFTGTETATVVSRLENIGFPDVGKDWTTLAETLYEAARYFAQVKPAYDPAHFTYIVDANDPYYFTAPRWAATDSSVPCCKSYVILFTDGEPTKDDDIPSALKNYYSSKDKFVDDVAYWAHTSDLRQSTIPVINESGKALDGDQTLTVYTFFAFGKGSELLQAAAKAGGFKDLNGNNEPDLQEEWDSVVNATGEAGSDGIPDTYFESDDATLLEDRLMATITSILQRSGAGSAPAVLASSSSGEGAVYRSFFFPSTMEGLKEVKWTGYLQSLFLDAFGNFREDSDGDGRLVYEQDAIIRTRVDSGSDQVLADRYRDADGNGLADTESPVATVGLKEVKGIWEAGSRLARTTPDARRLLTWIDEDDDGVVDGGEQIDFTTANAAKLSPYLLPGIAPFTAENIVKFVRGEQIPGLRSRLLEVGGSEEVWKLGDSIYAQPVVVGAPAQRYDALYGDSSYTAFLTKYRNRRHVVYLGANDGMLHAFNAGYFRRGDDPSTIDTEHGSFGRTPDGGLGGPELGEELFGFIPQELLAHLKWLALPEYTHVYYVDLTPKVTDARIFMPDEDHPNGWGTILMGGFRLGGSCGACLPADGGPPMVVKADFDGNPGTPDEVREFYSAYFVLDVTNPESADYPKLLWSFSSSDLGFSTTTPSMLRVSPVGSGVTDNASAKWYMIVGSGPTGYDGGISQGGKLFAIDLERGPGAHNAFVTSMTFETNSTFMGSPVVIDRDLDYRVDVAYMGSAIDDAGIMWRGKLYRLTMNGCSTTPCSPDAWGVSRGFGERQPTEVLDAFPAGGARRLGPVTAAPAVSIDDSNKVWLFAGTGRYFDMRDKTSLAQQHFVGVKDSVLNDGCVETLKTGCLADDLVDLSQAEICLVGVGGCGTTTDVVTGVSGASDFPSLVNLVKEKDGWFTDLSTTGERVLARPRVFGGLVLFPTFVPAQDPCAVTGQSSLYALYSLTGSAYSVPVLGTTASGDRELVNRTVSLGDGLATEVVMHLGVGSGYGVAGILVQDSLGALSSNSLNTSRSIVSRRLSWYNRRD